MHRSLALTELSDEELMREYQMGNEEAFSVLYERYSGKVYGYLQNRLKDRVWVDDVFQATFVKLHQARNRYDTGFPFAPWLFTVCKSVLVDQIRARNRIQEDLNPFEIDKAISPELALPVMVGGSIESDITARIALLPGAQREALELRFGVEELPFEEIARRLETSPANARQLVSRGIRRVRVLMRNKSGEKLK
jgi:RNA polymerase sigma factor (sigma-70 family)